MESEGTLDNRRVKGRCARLTPGTFFTPQQRPCHVTVAELVGLTTHVN